MRQRIADGQPLYGNSRLSDYTQGVAHGHSKGSADMLCPSLLPFLLRSPLRPPSLFFIRRPREPRLTRRSLARSPRRALPVVQLRQPQVPLDRPGLLRRRARRPPAGRLPEDVEHVRLSAGRALGACGEGGGSLSESQKGTARAARWQARRATRAKGRGCTYAIALVWPWARGRARA